MANGYSYSGLLEENVKWLADKHFLVDCTPQYQPGIHGENGELIKIDLFVPAVINSEQFPGGFYVECKFQDVNGTAYKNTEYDFRKIRSYYNLPTFAVIEGNESEPIKKIAARTLGGNFRNYMNLFGFSKLCHDIKSGCDIKPGDLHGQKKMFG